MLDTGIQSHHPEPGRKLVARLLLCLALMILALSAAALDESLSNQAPAKPARVVVPPPADPEVIRQGGDTVLDAVFVTVPVVDLTGSTAGYGDDYDEVCPYDGSTSPDVVYRLAPQRDTVVDIDMLGSTYDTKIYVYGEDMTLVACNDDFYPDYVSKIEAVLLLGDVKYFLVIDGYGGDFGDYVLNIYEFIPEPPCILECWDYAQLENEPPLEYDYVDNWNGGCNTDGDPPFQAITNSRFCGVSGFYLSGGGNSRDTDWFIIPIPAGNVLEITGDAEEPCWMFELGPQDCGYVGVVQQASIGPCIEGTMTIAGDTGSQVWFWVGPQEFASPDGSDVFEFDYTLWINVPCVVTTENHSWTDIKSLFR